MHNFCIQWPRTVVSTTSSVERLLVRSPIWLLPSDQCIDMHGAWTDDVAGSVPTSRAMHLFTISSDLASSHSSVGSCWTSSSVLVVPSSVRMLAVKCALKACIRNSSPTLNTFTPLSTWVRRASSRRWHSDPVWFGAPQNIVKTTRRHSHKKCKSPA